MFLALVSRGAGDAAMRRPRRDYNRRHTKLGGRQIASHQEIANFLAEVERRAFKQALFAVRDEDAALDIVQDAMLFAVLPTSYGGDYSRGEGAASPRPRRPG